MHNTPSKQGIVHNSILHNCDGGIKREGRNLPDRLAPRLRAGSLPYGEARGGDFALSELPHPHHGLNLVADIAILSELQAYIVYFPPIPIAINFDEKTAR